MTHIFKKFQYMELALEQAKLALQTNEWPVGAVIVYKDTVIACTYNRVESDHNPCAHAEILAAHIAQKYIYEETGDKFLSGCELFVTLQPCQMCFEYLKTLRIGKIIYGTQSIKGSESDVTVLDCVYEEECQALLKAFGEKLRGKGSKSSK